MPVGEPLDASTIQSTTAWQLFVAFLERLGVDKLTAHSANIYINASADEGTVRVGGFPRDSDGKVIVEGVGLDACLKTYTIDYRFTREAP